LKVFHDHFFVVGVQGIGCFVKEDVFGVFVHGAGNQDMLFLSLTDTRT
jgi:hypothetical protein